MRESLRSEDFVAAFCRLAKGIYQCVRVPLFVGFLVLLQGCTSGDSKYTKYGIGKDLYSSDLELATRNLDIYLGYICHQSGIGAPIGGDGLPYCQYGSMGLAQWTLLVQSGFNDIDRRCDGYLAWLENVRHRDAFYNSQLNQVARLTNSILTATNPTTGIAIGIVAEAFGYAKSVFNDHQARIMLGYESSTIKTIVSERRIEFRKKFSDVGVRYKPDAVYILRSYLRICMPYTITMDANTYARATATGTSKEIMEQNDPEQVRKSIISKTLFDDIPPGGSRDEFESTDPDLNKGKPKINGARGGHEGSILLSRGKLMQQNLCLPTADQTGGFYTKTRNAIRLYEWALHEDAKAVNGQIDTEKEEGNLIRLNGCPRHFLNAYERYKYNDASALMGFQDTLHAAVLMQGLSLKKADGTTDIDVKEFKTGKFDKPTRAAISAISAVIAEKRPSKFKEIDKAAKKLGVRNPEKELTPLLFGEISRAQAIKF